MDWNAMAVEPIYSHTAALAYITLYIYYGIIYKVNGDGTVEVGITSG